MATEVVPSQEDNDKDAEIAKLKTQNQVLRKMAAALQELANSEKQINAGLRYCVTSNLGVNRITIAIL